MNQIYVYTWNYSIHGHFLGLYAQLNIRMITCYLLRPEFSFIVENLKVSCCSGGFEF